MSWSAKRWGTAVFCALTAIAAPAHCQPYAEQTIELEGETVRYSIRAFPPGANVVDPSVPLQPNSALNTAKLLELHLSTGAAEEAALLSNAPRRRFEVLKDYRESVGEDNFKQVYTEYFEPRNRVLAELAIGEHSLLIWHLRDTNRYVGQFYVRVDGRTLMDDVPSPERARLRRILEAVRAGKLSLPGI
jgi:hypothetical protein